MNDYIFELTYEDKQHYVDTAFRTVRAESLQRAFELVLKGAFDHKFPQWHLTTIVLIDNE